MQKISLDELVQPLKGKPTADQIPPRQWEDGPKARVLDELGGKWVPTIQDLIAKYEPHVVAYFVHSPFGWKTFCVDMLFSSQEKARECVVEIEKIPI
jgi:hypothetical protein